VWVTNHSGPWQSVVVKVNRLGEIDTPAFRAFLRETVEAFQKTIKRLKAKPEDFMPWKIDGERWHLGEKGFPPGRKLRWDRSILPNLLDLVRKIEPKIEVVWDNRAVISLKVPGINRAWAQWRTKESEGLDCRFLGKSGQFNLSQVESFGVQPTINGNRSDGDSLRLLFQSDSHLHASDLARVLTDHLAGFREAFTKSR
jgi:excinuclease ABC subunit A